jgi:uncharacterized protein YfaS (alpha-2-macroglobulin family)
MAHASRFESIVRLSLVIALVVGAVAWLVTLQTSQAGSARPLPVATYSKGVLRVTLPYKLERAGPGQLLIEVLSPENSLLGHVAQRTEVTKQRSQWQEEIKLDPPLPIDELVWQRIHYRFEYDDGKTATFEGIDAISQILRRPVIHILGQTAYLAGGQAGVRVIVTDSKDEVIAGHSSLRIELLAGNGKSHLLYRSALNHRGTSDAQFQFPAGQVGNYRLRYVADTPIGSTDFTQDVRLEDKVSILLTSEKPLYQPGQTIHARALALDRSDHEAAARRKLTFELEDSRGNKVFKKATSTDQYGVASAEFGLADEVNLGTYHLRALMGDGDAPRNSAEIALNVARYVLPKFKVAVEFSNEGKKQKRGYQPGDHVTGTVRANYFFGKPVDSAELTMKASAADVVVVEVASASGKTDSDGCYKFDLVLPNYLAGKPLNHQAARVLIEATVRDSVGHSETRGEPITVSESPLLVTAVPEGGVLVPNLENEVFILASYPDGTPAKAIVTIHSDGNSDQSLSTDDGGVALARITPRPGKQNLQIEASDQEGNKESSKVELESRAGEDQVLLRSEHAVYRAGERIQLKVFSSKPRGAAYVDVVKDGQTVLTRDVDLQNGQAELSLTATAEMAGTVDVSAYLFSKNAIPVADHRLLFVQPANELKIETAADASLYKPGGDARIKFHVTNSHGEGVQAALGLQVVDEAVFALAEKQPGFAKVFFYLEQEVMKPRYEIHSIEMPEIVEPTDSSKSDQRDRAARALFSATEIVSRNKFEIEIGKDVPMTKYAEYWQRYQVQFQKQANELAQELSKVYEKEPRASDPAAVYAKMARSGGSVCRDPWGENLTLEPARWDSSRRYYLMRSAGPDHQLNTADDLQAVLLFQRKWLANVPGPGPTKINVNVEHDRGPFNGRAEITGTVNDPSGAVISGADVQLHGLSNRKIRSAITDASGQFSFSAVPGGDYSLEIVATGFKVASGVFTVGARDRAVLTATLSVGQASEVVEVTGASVTVATQVAVPGVAGGIGFGSGGGVGGGVFKVGIDAQNLAIRGREFDRLEQFAAMQRAPNSAVLAKEGTQSPAVRVRSYFPEALYINPEIITDKDGRASVVIPMADSITSWRMAMIASTQQGALGTSTSSLKVFQDFFVDLDMPVTITEGDRISIPVAIYNYSDSRGDVNLQLHADDWFSLVQDSGEKSVAVEPARVGSSQFTLQARHIGKFKLKLSARMQGAADRADIVVREIEVIPNGREQSVVFNGRLENTIEHEVTFPGNAIPEANKIFVRLYPGPMSQVVEGMDSILRMPNGCFEQTSSSTYPNVLALDYMRHTKKLTPEVRAKAEGYIANGYQRLLTFEVPDGGFSWFGSAPANKILTAYGLMEFYDMSRVHDVDPKLISRTQQWLAGQQREDGSWKPDAQFINEGATNRYNSDILRITAYIAWALKNTGYQGSAVEKAREFVEKRIGEKVDTYTLAVIANFAASYGDREFTRRALQQLLDARTEKDEQVWWDAEETSVYATGPSAAVETTGLAVQALLQSGSASGTAGKALNYIASKKDAYGTWGTTQATIMALRALLTATDKSASDVRGTLTVLLDGKPAEELQLTPENNDLLHQFVFKEIASSKASTVELRFDGKGGLAYQIVGSYFVPWEDKPLREAISIDVAYDRTRLAVDDVATVTATVRNNLNKTANMVMVDLGVPPGFDLLSEDLQEFQQQTTNSRSGHLSKFSLTATQAILYFDSLAAQETVKLKYRLRAKYPIRARTFKSRVYEYYDPEVSAVARPVQLEVAAR